MDTVAIEPPVASAAEMPPDPQHLPALSAASLPDTLQTDKNLDMVRNILFGEYIREAERRQATLERFVHVWIGSLREEAHKNFDTLMVEIKLLKELLTEESKSRRNDTRAARERFEQVGKSIDELGGKTRNAHECLEQQLQHETTRIGQEMVQQRDALLSQLQQTSAQLQQDKADRRTVASLLQHAARQLADDPA